MSDPVIEVRGLNQQVPAAEASAQNDLVILQDVSLSIKAGESVAITGASGSGKSTLLGLLAGLDSPSSGSIRLFGQDLSQSNEDQRAAIRMGRVGFVFQSFHLLDNLTALENVMLPLELADKHKDIREQAQQALIQVGLRDRMEQFVTRLSGGEQQRVALARAFVSQPDILFADEPTGNLDRATGHDVAEHLFRLQQDHATTLVLVTHDENLAAQCQKGYRLVDGQLALVTERS